MKKAEIVLIGIAILALLMKFAHLPGSGLLLFVSFSLLAMVYMFFGFALFNNSESSELFKSISHKKISTIRVIGSIGTGLALSVSIQGVLFKIQSYPGALMMLSIGLFGLVIIAIISLIKTQKDTGNYYSTILKRVVIFGIICTFLIFLPEKTWLNWKHPNNPEFVQAVLDAQVNPTNEELWDKVEEERVKMKIESEK